MPKLPKSSPERKASNLIPITVAVIGAAAVLASAVVGNWDKLFPGKQRPVAVHAVATSLAAAVQPTPPNAQSAPPLLLAQQSTTGSQSPAVSGVGRDVIMNFGTKETSQGPTGSQRGALDGDWKTSVFYDGGGNRLQFYLKFKTLPDGRIIGSVQPIDPDTGKTIFSPYGFKDGKLSGNSLTVSFYEGAKKRDASGDLTVEIYETLYGEIAGDAIELQYVFPDMAPVETTAHRAGKPTTSNSE